MIRRLAAATALSGLLVLAGCQNPDGSTNWGNTLLLGAGVGVAAALVAGAASDSPRHYAGNYGRPGRGYGGYAPAYGHGGGYGGGYRRW